MFWVIVANSNNCQIFSYNTKSKEARIVKHIEHPENRHKSSDNLTSDKPGHYQTGSHVGGSYAPHTDPKAVAIDAFAREIATTANDGRNQQAFQKLILISPARMAGLILAHADKHLTPMISKVIHEDVNHFTEKQLSEYVSHLL